RVLNISNNEPIAFATVYIDSTNNGTTSDIDGNYKLDNLDPGTYNIACSFVGFEKKVFYEVIVSNVKPTNIDFSLTEKSLSLDEIVITPTLFNKTEESPVSMRTINASEIYRNPGGNRDISKVIQILPGVGSSASFRNDIIVRGGAPNENRFYLDGIEVPNINHFATQGSSGGPVGMLNVNFIRELDFYAGAFPANRGNALSSILEFKQIDGNDEKMSGNFMLGSSDVGLTLDGPMGKKSTYIFSLRRSYLQFLFKALALPFLPTYNDIQYKQSININQNNKLKIIGLGAIDDFSLNTEVNEGIDDTTLFKRNEYILGNLPINTQWNYTIGGNWFHYSKNSFQNVIVSRNHLNNNAIKYQDNIESPENLILDYTSQEIENKVRLETTKRNNGWKLNAGVGFENVLYTNSTFNRTQINGNLFTIDFDSKLSLNKYALFGQASKAIAQNKLKLSFGLRSDFTDYSKAMLNPLKQLSPRLSAAYNLNKKISLNFNIGRYFQLPAYTVMGYRDSQSTLINQSKIKYIQADHFIAGLEYNPTELSKITVEGFYKIYQNYPFQLLDSISLANLGGDFGVIGNTPIASISEGRSYGFEILAQQKLSSSIYGILSYTYVRSEFKDKNEVFIPSSWDNRHILNITAGKKLKKNWEVGVKFRLLGGAPYTPFDLNTTALKNVWDITRQGVYDWDQLNTKRNQLIHGLDIRIDKKWYFKKWAMNLYIDIQNVYNFQADGPSYIDVDKDAQGNPITNPSDPLAYKITEYENTSGTILPSIGLMMEF
ncbi:MAG: TonB-dependent receptor, partial [Flavobacteriales bacterium]|nr:TonB-dependent receptor [Flavobacteriales bacterium]